MRALLDLDKPPTAVFCINDLVAAGALKVCSIDGVKVPDEMSIVGCDDIELSSLVVPELTTIAIPARELGARAARMLLNRLQSNEVEPRVGTRPQRTIASRLVVRGTTAPPPKSAQ
jgi:LacI family transcriptional regulator